MAEQAIPFSIDAASGVPFYRQIIRQIEIAVLAKRLVPGDRLPTIRALAVRLKINPNTIAKSYNELEIRGIVTTQVGSGTFISDKRPEIEDGERDRKIAETVARFVREMKALGSDRAEALELVRNFKEED